jgi:predicted dehydrogenase
MIANAGHIPAWRSLGEDAVVVAVHNRTLGKAERTASRHGIPKAYDDLAAMLGETKPDVVSVCTPNVSHDGIVRECLDAGCHVVCEKPLTTEYDSAVALFERAEAVGRKLVVAQTLRFTAQIRAAFDIASTGALGEVYYAEAGALRRRGIPTWGTFHIKEESGGGPLFDLGVHMLDSMLWIMGNPRVVSASGATYQKL